MNKFIVCLLLWSSFGINNLNAQSKVLTFEEAVKIGLKNGILLNQQRNNLQYNEMQRMSNWAGLGPTLSVNGQAVRIDGNTFNQNEAKVVNGLFDQVSGSLNANINIFNGFAQVSKVRQSTSLVEAQAFYINRASQDIINTISGQYLQVLLDVELLTIAKENALAQQKQLSQVKEQVNVGAKSPVDEYNQDSQTKAAEIKALQAEINLINDKSLLSLTLLLEPTQELEVVKPEWDLNKTNEGIDLNSLISSSLTRRGDYLRAVKNEEAAKYGMRSTRAALTPTLSAFGSLYSAYNHAHGDPTVRPFSTQFSADNLKKYVGLQLSIPILGGQQTLQNRANYVQQRVAYENSMLTKKNTEIQVKTDIVRAYQNYNLYAKTYSVSLDQLKAADLALQFETERYNLGITNFVDYANANKVYVQSQTDKAQAEYKLLFQKVALDYAAGTLKVEDVQ